MTRAEGMEQFDRYAHAGYQLPAEFAAAFEEWFRIFGRAKLDDVDAAIERLMRHRRSPFWPTPGELTEHLEAVIAARGPADSTCPRCHGSKWIDADPFTANGGLVYANTVIRCPDCGTPPPNTQHLAGKHTPLTAAEREAWEAAHEPKGAIIRTQEEFRAYLRKHAPKGIR